MTEPKPNPHKHCTKRLLVMLCLAIIWTFTGCVTYNKCLDKFGTLATDSVTVPVTIITPADSASGTVNCDTLRVGYPVYFYSETPKGQAGKGATVKLEKQANGSVKATADCPPVKAQKQVKCPPQVKFSPEPVMKWWHWFLTGVAVGAILLIIIKR